MTRSESAASKGNLGAFRSAASPLRVSVSPPGETGRGGGSGSARVPGSGGACERGGGRAVARRWPGVQPGLREPETSWGSQQSPFCLSSLMRVHGMRMKAAFPGLPGGRAPQEATEKGLRWGLRTRQALEGVVAGEDGLSGEGANVTGLALGQEAAPKCWRSPPSGSDPWHRPAAQSLGPAGLLAQEPPETPVGIALSKCSPVAPTFTPPLITSAKPWLHLGR